MAQAAYVGRVNLYLFDTTTNQYTDYGSQGLAIMGSTDGVYKMGCYNDKGEYVATAPITANNEASARLALQGQGYVNFKDEQNRNWSILFPSEDDAIEFGAHFAVAMYGAAFQPESNVMVCDVAQGKKDRLLFVNDKVKVRYTSWVVTRGAVGKDICKLGSKLETNESDEKPYAFTVPANHVSVTSDMKGFEGMVVGVGEEGRRYVVIPQAAKRGAGPNAHMCFYVNVLRKKSDDVDPAKNNNNNGMMGYGQGQGMYNNNNMGYGQQQQQQQQWGGGHQPLALGAGPNMGGPMNAYNGALSLVDGGAGGAVAPAPVAPPVVVEAPPPPPPGFNAEQLQIVDRMRDQIQALTLQLRETTQKLDMFRHDFNQNEAKTKPQSLAAAQLEHSITKMLQETEALKDELSQRDTMLRQVEEKNKDLQKKVDRFSATANQLADEKKSAVNAGSEEKLDLDRRIAQLQMNVTRINGERDDVMRHMSTVKRLLEVSDQDMKTEKNKLQLAIVQFQTNETKLVTIEENLAEERARKRVLESKVISLGEEMRSVAEELRIKEGQIEERRRKIEADKLHYTQVMEEERSQAAQELRDLRQELIDEIAIRDRRYAEEKLRVAQESTERGRVQGVEDGTNEALLEADAKIQEYVLSVQRCKGEVEGMKIRLRQIKEQAEADQRRINAQSATLARTLDELIAQNSTAEIELETLKATKATVEEQTYDLLCQTLRSLTRPVSKRDLLTIIHELRIKKPVDFSFEVSREHEEASRLEQEREELKKFIRASVAGTYPPPAMPPIRTKAPEERPVMSTFVETAAVAPQPQPQATVYQDPMVASADEEEEEAKEDEVRPKSDNEAHSSSAASSRSRSAEADEHLNEDSISSAPQPVPSRDEGSDGENEIQPPEAFTGDNNGEDEAGTHHQQEEVEVEEAVEEDGQQIKIGNGNVPLPALDSTDEDEGDEADAKDQNQNNSDEDDDDQNNNPQSSAQPLVSSSSSTPPAPAPASAPRNVLPSFTDDEDEDDKFATKSSPTAPAPAPKKAPAKKASAALFGDSDSDADGPIAAPLPRKAPSALPKKAPPKRAALFDDDSD